MYFLMV